MMEEMKTTMWVCECCLLESENGDTSSCRDYYEHTHPAMDIPGNFVMTDKTHIVGWFSSYCESCGVTLPSGATMWEYVIV